ncbi:MAG: hypothetical protein RRZ84_08390 [Romboutsia sp.]
MSCCGGCNKKNNTIDMEEYEELKEFLQEEIKDFRVVDYMDDNGYKKQFVEVEFEEYILEVDDIDMNNVVLDTVIDSVIRNNMK